MNTLLELFSELAPPPTSALGSTELTASPIAGLAGHRVAKSSANEPLLLVSTLASDMPIPPPVRLENLTVTHGVNCRILQGERVVEEGVFTVLRCLSADPWLRSYFFSIGAPFLSSLGPSPAPTQVAQLLNVVVELFRALSDPPRKSVQGLWAELFLITCARDARAAAKAWHVAPGERYDFSAGIQRIEVKCAVGRERRHHFSLAQLTPPSAAAVLVASICTERSGGGTSLGVFLTKLRSCLSGDTDTLLRVESVIAGTLGTKLGTALEETFDLEMAQESLAFFDLSSVPRPPGNIPPEVSDVRFVADLTHLRGVDPRRLVDGGGLFEAATPA